MTCLPGGPPQPTFSGFTAWLPGAVGVPANAIPAGSPYPQWAYDVAIATVNHQLMRVPGPQYMLAVYNLAADQLINWCPDVTPTVPYPDASSQVGFFAWAREKFDVTAFAAGVVQSAADESTSETLATPDALKNLTLGQLQNLKTPWGRQYLAFAQTVGTMWGLS